MRLDGLNALVTGAASGLGAEISRAFAREGARVLVTDVNLEGAELVAAECTTAAATSSACACDVADSASVAAAFASFDAQFAKLDILVNNAGIIHSDPDYIAHINSTQQAQVAELMSGQEISSHWEAIERLSDEMFDRMLKIHLYGTFYCTREALPRMRTGGGGRIINMGSIMGSASLPGAPDYCAAKGAILAFTRATAREAASYGVLANALAPGFVDTPLLDPLDDPSRQMVAMQTPLGRMGTPSEIAAAAVFLAGPDATFITGQTISPNGGIYMSQ